MNPVVSWVRRFEGAAPTPQLPSMQVHLGPSLPVWAVRVVAGALAVGTGVLVAGSVATTVLAVAAGVLVLIWPGREVPVLVAGLIAWALLVDEPGAAEAGAVVLGVHGFLVLARLVGGVGWAARLQTRALWQVGRRFLVLQAAAQGLLHLSLALPTAGAWVVWVAAGALAALGVCTAMLVRSLRAMP